MYTIEIQHTAAAFQALRQTPLKQNNLQFTNWDVLNFLQCVHLDYLCMTKNEFDDLNPCTILLLSNNSKSFLYDL